MTQMKTMAILMMTQKVIKDDKDILDCCCSFHVRVCIIMFWYPGIIFYIAFIHDGAVFSQLT